MTPPSNQTANETRSPAEACEDRGHRPLVKLPSGLNVRPRQIFRPEGAHHAESQIVSLASSPDRLEGFTAVKSPAGFFRMPCWHR